MVATKYMYCFPPTKEYFQEVVFICSYTAVEQKNLMLNCGVRACYVARLPLITGDINVLWERERERERETDRQR